MAPPTPESSTRTPYLEKRDTKREKRKQSNRESAKRSRLRKQAECDSLRSRVDALVLENTDLRTQMAVLSEDLRKLKSESEAYMEQLRQCQQASRTPAGPDQGEDNGQEEIKMEPHEIHMLDDGARTDP